VLGTIAVVGIPLGWWAFVFLRTPRPSSLLIAISRTVPPPRFSFRYLGCTAALCGQSSRGLPRPDRERRKYGHLGRLSKANRVATRFLGGSNHRFHQRQPPENCVDGEQQRRRARKTHGALTQSGPQKGSQARAKRDQFAAFQDQFGNRASELMIKINMAGASPLLDHAGWLPTPWKAGACLPCHNARLPFEFGVWTKKKTFEDSGHFNAAAGVRSANSHLLGAIVITLGGPMVNQRRLLFVLCATAGGLAT
jgi:hypothetical protein